MNDQTTPTTALKSVPFELTPQKDFDGMPEVTPSDIRDPLFKAIWEATKTWEVGVPEHYAGHVGMNGSHVMLILNELRKLVSYVPARNAISLTPEGRLARRANTISVTSTASQDGRSLESYVLNYSPENSYELFLLCRTLDLSEGVQSYLIYDASGERVPPKKTDTIGKHLG